MKRGARHAGCGKPENGSGIGNEDTIRVGAHGFQGLNIFILSRAAQKQKAQ